MKFKPPRFAGIVLLSILILGMVIPTSVYTNDRYVSVPAFQPDMEMAMVKHVLDTANWNDHIHMVITSPGGVEDVLRVLETSLKTTHAYFITVDIPFYAYSCAAWLSMDADQIIMEPGSELGFHYGSSELENPLTGQIVSHHILSPEDLTSPNPNYNDPAHFANNHLLAEPSWLFSQKDWMVMYSGDLAVIHAKDFYHREPYLYPLIHAIKRDYPNIMSALFSGPRTQHYLMALHSKFITVQSFIPKWWP